LASRRRNGDPPGTRIARISDTQESAISIGLVRISVGFIVAAATVACSKLQQRDAGMSGKPDPQMQRAR